MRSSAGPPALVRVVRSGLVESEHRVHVAICDADGRVVAGAGDPSRRVFARSSMKPVQAAVSLSAIGDGADPRHVAIMCASHNGESIHVRAMRRVLALGPLDASALRNPPGWPIDAEAMARSREPSRERHNCSGKHAGMLVASVRAGWDIGGYLRPRHPLQRRVLRAAVAGTGHDDLEIGVDGCGVPVHGLPLAGMATLYARLTRPDRFGDLGPFVETAVRAMRDHPYLVAGRKRLDTALMQDVAGVVSKVGAEALACAGWIDAGLGVAVKVEDGGDRAAGPVLLAALAAVGAIDASALRRLDRFVAPWVTGGGARVGQLEVELELRRSVGRWPGR
jgi:L-asparaginase II